MAAATAIAARAIKAIATMAVAAVIKVAATDVEAVRQNQPSNFPSDIAKKTIAMKMQIL
jgi:hypothetical protein